MKIIFMGTPAFAVPALETLLDSGHDVRYIFTQPDRPKNRGKKLAVSAVKEAALSRGFAEERIIQPLSLRKGEDAETSFELIRQAAPSLIIVAAYGQILPENILNIPKYGCVNLHASLLPKYRGASPINACICAGESESGVTLMYMEKGLDTGDMLAVTKVSIGGDTTAAELTEQLARAGAELLRDTLPKFEDGSVQAVPQDDSLATYAGLITKEQCRIDFNAPARTVHNHIRGLPSAYTFIGGKRVKILQSAVRENVKGEVGQLLRVNGEMIVACGEGSVAFLKIAPEGKSIMSGGDFLNGIKAVKID